jgi:hypothetical protein
MSTIENPQPPAERWPLEHVEIGEVLELAKVVRTMDDYQSFTRRHPEVHFGQISVRQLCSLYLEDMHARAGLPLDYEHY